MSLDRLLGTWDITMDHSSMSEPVTGRQHYERTLEGAFVLLTWTYDHPEFPNATALFSDDKVWYFDTRGVHRLFDLTLENDDGWSMVRIVPDFSQRFTARFVGNDVMEAEGEYSEDLGATWQHDFTMSCRRVG